VSSTFTDLKAERQAAVEAILTAGHIPAGMELFAAGDESQMEVIRRWISESDVFLLILGGRYGSLEPTAGKSYVHLEYDHAVDQRKPFFAVVIEDDTVEKRVKELGSIAIETDNKTKLAEFRAIVTSRMVRFWRDSRDIKLATLETLADFSRRDDLVGWTRTDQQLDASAVAEEIARLSRENTSLRSELARVVQTQQQTMYQGLTFEEYYQLLAAIPIANLTPTILDLATETARVFGDAKPGLLHLAWVLSARFRTGFDATREDSVRFYCYRLGEFGLLRAAKLGDEQRYYSLSDAGNQFFMRLRIARDGVRADDFVMF